MLAALIMLGLLPLVALPFVESQESDDSEDEQHSQSVELDENENEGAETLNSFLDEGNHSEEEIDQEAPVLEPHDPDAGFVYSLDATEEESLFDDFEPGVDFIELDLKDVDGDVSFEIVTNADGAAVDFFTDDQPVTTLVFADLEEVPADDIMLQLKDDDTDVAFEMSLAEAIKLIAEEMEPDAEYEFETEHPLSHQSYSQSAGPVGDGSRNPIDENEVGILEEPDDDSLGSMGLNPKAPANILQPVIETYDFGNDPAPSTVSGQGLQPTDPDAPDPLDPGVDPNPDVIDPLDPDQPDVPPTVPTEGPGLNPNDPDTDGPLTNADQTLSDLMARNSENTAGMGETLTQANADGTTDLILDPINGGVGTLADDGVLGTGEGHIEMGDSAPVISSDQGIDVVSGSNANDVITTGDGAAFAFGGAGNDALTSGEGAAALYGGAGQDVLQVGLGASGQYLDGGIGDDSLLGGADGDTLEGGEHGGAQSIGSDTIDGGAGDDLIRGGYGSDMLMGGEGDDVIDHLGRTEERAGVTRHEFAWHTDGAADTLDGGAGDDMLIMDRNDEATGGDGHDVFWVWHDGADSATVAEVKDFVVGEDFLRVSLNPHIGENEEPDILVEPSPDGVDGLVKVNGNLVAILRGAPSATVSDIYAEVRPDIF